MEEKRRSRTKDEGTITVQIGQVIGMNVYICIQDLSDQLNAQRLLSTQQQDTIDELLRKVKGIDPKIPTSTSGTPVDAHYQVNYILHGLW